MESMEYVKHPLIKKDKVEARTYQQMIFANATKENTLVVVPTALGKTIIAILLTAYKLTENPNKRIIMLTPTKPLAQQHYESFQNLMNIDPDDIILLTGQIPSDKRKKIWKSAKIIICTPQTLRNDLEYDITDLDDISLLIIDEAHRAVGDYAYTKIAKNYIENVKDNLILALTASPGHDKRKIEEVCETLQIENVDIRTEKDEDVKPYIKPIELEWVKVDLPKPFKEIRRLLQDILRNNLQKLVRLRYLKAANLNISKKEILNLQKRLQAQLSKSKSGAVFAALKHQAVALKIHYSLELLETQGIPSLYDYLAKMSHSKVKSVQALMKDPKMEDIVGKVEKLYDEGIYHPKLKKLPMIVLEEIEKDENSKIIIFTQYRNTAKIISDKLKGYGKIDAVRFVGQASKGKDKGLSQKKQAEVLDYFRQGSYNVLVATSVAEEGLDIPSVDLVIFYEPIPSEIRTIQRRGRTGRKQAGRAIMMITNDTRDEAYYWSSFHKEKRMKGTLRGMKKKSGQTILETFTRGDDSINIFVDMRELDSKIDSKLEDLGMKVIKKQLDVADFLVSDRCAIERKTGQDFLSSIKDRRLFRQAKQMNDYFDRSIMIIEGDYKNSGFHPNSIRGALVALSVDYGISVFYTKDIDETSQLIYNIAKREQKENKRDLMLRGKKRAETEKDFQINLVESLPKIGPNLAKNLMEKFRSISNLVCASEKDIAEVEGVGKKRAKEIKKIFGIKY